MIASAFDPPDLKEQIVSRTGCTPDDAAVLACLLTEGNMGGDLPEVLKSIHDKKALKFGRDIGVPSSLPGSAAPIFMGYSFDETLVFDRYGVAPPRHLGNVIDRIRRAMQNRAANVDGAETGGREALTPTGHLAADVKKTAGERVLQDAAKARPGIRLDPQPHKWGDILIYADDDREDGVRVRTTTARQGAFFSAEQLGFQTKGGNEMKAWLTFRHALDSPRSSGGMFRASISYSDSPKTKRECVRRQVLGLNRLLMAAFGIASRPFKSTFGKGNLLEGLWLSEFQVRG